MSDEGVHVPALVYVSGGMSNLPDHGVVAFSEARDALRALGYSVLCPSECSVVQNTGGQKSRTFHLRRDVQMVMLADEVCVLDGWESSKGSVLEVAVALALGIPVWAYSTGKRLDEALAVGFDIRRSFMPLDFDEWRGEIQSAEVDTEEADCEKYHIPYRGASAAYCKLRHGHGGLHRDSADRTWAA